MCSGCHASQVEKYIDGSMLMDLTKNIEGSSLVNMKKFPQDLVGLYESDNKNYAIPKDFDTVGLWYNKTLFDEAGIAYPDETWTWDNAFRNSKKINKQRKGYLWINSSIKHT